MGGRKDTHGKRHLSIIEEIDYSSDDGLPQYQGHDYGRLGLENILNANLVRNPPLDNRVSHISVIQRGAETREQTIHNDDNDCKTQQVFDRNYSIFSDQMNTAEINSLSPNQYDIHGTLNNSVKSSINEVTPGNDHTFKKKNSIPFIVNQDSSNDSIHEMFQVLIKCIEETQDNQTRYSAVEAEEVIKTYPLLYLTGGKIEKQPPAVDNIISSFKEKLHLPNGKRQPVRQKSRRTLAPEKMADKEDEVEKTKSISEETCATDKRETEFSENNSGVCMNIEERCMKQDEGKRGLITNDSRSIFRDTREVSTVNECKEENASNTMFNYNADEKEGIKSYEKSSTSRVNDIETTTKHQDHMNEIYMQAEQDSCIIHPPAPEMNNSQTVFYSNIDTNIYKDTVPRLTIIPEVTGLLVNDTSQSSKNENVFVFPPNNSGELHNSLNPIRNEIVSEEDSVIACGSQSDNEEGHAKEMLQYKTVDQDNSEIKNKNEHRRHCDVEDKVISIPIFKRQGTKDYDDDEGCWNNFENQIKPANEVQKQYQLNTNKNIDFLTIPNPLSVPPAQQQIQLQQNSNSEKVPSKGLAISVSDPATSSGSKGQQGKGVSFLNPNGSIPKRPMLRHVSQPNMNAHTTPQFQQPTRNCSTNHLVDGANSPSGETKFQTKDLDSDLTKLKATAVRLKLMTRRPSYLEWLEERRKNCPPLLIIDPVMEIETALSRNITFKSNQKDITVPPNTIHNDITGLDKQCQSSNNETTITIHLRRVVDHLNTDNSSGSNGSSRRSSSNSSSNVSNDCDGSVDLDDVFNVEVDENPVSQSSSLRSNETPGSAKEYTMRHNNNSNQRNGSELESDKYMVMFWRQKMSGDRLTPERKQRIDESLEWLRNELKAMRSQDQALARQLLTLRHEMHKLKLSWSCQEHRDLLDEVQCDLEEFQEFSKVLDLPSTVYLDTPLKNVGVTRLNISARRFSTC